MTAQGWHELRVQLAQAVPAGEAAGEQRRSWPSATSESVKLTFCCTRAVRRMRACSTRGLTTGSRKFGTGLITFVCVLIKNKGSSACSAAPQEFVWLAERETASLKPKAAKAGSPRQLGSAESSPKSYACLLTSVGHATALPSSQTKLLATKGANRAACRLFRSRANTLRLQGPPAALLASSLVLVTSS